MTEIPPEVEQQLAAMDEGEFTAFVARVRAPEEGADPMERAAQALRSLRGVDRRGTATKEDAAAAVRAYGSGSRNG
jgi:hypothetical protein